MKKHINYVSIIFLSYCLYVIVPTYSYASLNYPIIFSTITKADAKYDTPENAFIAKKSALINHDLTWYYETLTVDTVELYKKLFSQNGIDPSRHFDVVSKYDKTIIYDKIDYKDGVILLVETTTPEGAILRGPVVLIQENGLWKTTVKYRADSELKQYYAVIKPEYFDFFDLSVFPPKWNIAQHGSRSRHGHGKTSFHKDFKNTILCVLSPKKDEEVSVSDILPETLRLNHTVSPVPWHSSMHEPPIDKAKYAHIISSPGDFPWPKRKEAVDWWERCAVKNDHRKPLMLVRFDMFEVMQTFLQEDAGNEYDVSITGTLKDGKEFKATAKCRRN